LRIEERSSQLSALSPQPPSRGCACRLRAVFNRHSKMFYRHSVALNRQFELPTISSQLPSWGARAGGEVVGFPGLLYNVPSAVKASSSHPQSERAAPFQRRFLLKDTKSRLLHLVLRGDRLRVCLVAPFRKDELSELSGDVHIGVFQCAVGDGAQTSGSRHSNRGKP